MNINTMNCGIPPLDVTKDGFDWNLYKMRLEQFFKSSKNETEDNKKNLLLTVCTDKTLILLRGLCSPNEPTDSTFDELSKIIQTHFTTPKLKYQERRKFFEAYKDNDENVTEYVLRLRSLASTCNFGVRLEGNIVDKFVTGLSGKIYARLCEENSWTIENALEVAKKYELNAASNQHASLNFIKKKSSSSKENKKQKQRESVKCKQCGFSNHEADRCRCKNITCNSCGIKGHMASVCNNHAIPSSSNAINAITNDSVDNCEYDKFLNSYDEDNLIKILSINNYSNDQDNPIFISLNVFGNIIKFQVDTGSPVTVLPGHVFDSLFAKYDIKLYNDKSVPTGYGGHKLNVRGFINPCIHYNDISQHFNY